MAGHGERPAMVEVDGVDGGALTAQLIGYTCATTLDLLARQYRY
jgi:hypothetical protein